MLETVKKPQLPQEQPPQLWSLGRVIQMGLAGFAFLYLLGYGFAGQMMLSPSPAQQVTSNVTDTDDALTMVP
ncbi:hypothetical protein [Trichocoleus sp. FACHB-262]|uniref:hypothetical protein n=1 Tax=Trichocoleus sp. FACHB-262 TaxID=2692869 RepID=UPI00168235C3|nr:hypothetical protein [Trichocoleus sp. FACHB-262]MBD2122018.1 hypothetical protein [Trichocoleus sp. FACHB-262]